VDGDFRDDVGVEAVAEIDGVDVVAANKASQYAVKVIASRLEAALQADAACAGDGDAGQGKLTIPSRCT
jgi:hypothetical protein